MSDIPAAQKTGVSAYQRWELASFDPQEIPQAPSIAEGELERLRESARSDGYAAGYAQGQEHARAIGAELSALLAGAEHELQMCDVRISESILDLAVGMARQIVRSAIRVRPELVLPVVQEAVRALPHFSQSAHVVVNPHDSVLVREHLGEHIARSGWTLVEDSSIERGGCRIETPASQIDATLETRWQRVISATGREDAWLAPA